MVFYKPKRISEIKDEDRLVAVVGKVIDTSENKFILDDDSGRIEIETDKKLENNEIVRAFCTIENGKLKANIIQNMDGLDMELFNKVKELYNKTGV